MALKAYKHLTDGEVKLVAAGSAEETALLADVVHDASYLQLTSAGHSQEVAAAQGTALWVDVTSDLGSGGSSAQVFEVTDLPIPSGTDWSNSPHVLGHLDLEPYEAAQIWGYLELAAPLAVDQVGLLAYVTPTSEVAPDVGAGSQSLVDFFGAGDGVYWKTAPDFLMSPIFWPSRATPPEPVRVHFVVATGGPVSEDITVVRVRAAFLVI